MRAFLSRHLATLSWSAIVALLLLTPDTLDAEAPHWLERAMALGGDKLVHAALFFVQALTLDRSLRRTAAAGRAPWFAAAFAVLYGAVLEVLQRGVPGRGFEGADIVADAAGAVLWALLSRQPRQAD